MGSRLSIHGHSCAPVLLMFPFGLLTVAILLDLFDVLGGPRLVGTLAYCTVAVALVGGALRALAVQISAAAAGDRAERQATAQRLLLDAAVLLVFAVILLLRMRTPERTVGPGLLVIEVAGLVLAVAGSLAPAVPGTRPTRGSEETVLLAQILDRPGHR
ncbi:DUF2231 domain-containing protein [Nucisporomicrobium flavum]|uniref:DUF2231 domain-containing protein n=1 Tax=Nucisporomicrobium flavum TaxID=2785915 RepID=UPI0018F2E16A|nr:DUF2231 domain-containing protein [Nucisporomicrobium flavum]